jgi:hypothetical protein
MSRNPVEWIGVGVIALVAAVFVLFGVSLVALGVFLMWNYGLAYWRSIPVGLLFAGVPLVLYGIGRASGVAWARLAR